MIINNTKNTTISGCSCSSSEFNAHENKFYSILCYCYSPFYSNRIESDYYMKLGA